MDNNSQMETNMKHGIPETMQAIRLEEENGKLRVRQLPVPKPGHNEVLVRMAASTINPSDIGFMYSTTGYSNRALPVTRASKAVERLSPQEMAFFQNSFWANVLPAPKSRTAMAHGRNTC